MRNVRLHGRIRVPTRVDVVYRRHGEISGVVRQRRNQRIAKRRRGRKHGDVRARIVGDDGRVRVRRHRCIEYGRSNALNRPFHGERCDVDETDGVVGSEECQTRRIVASLQSSSRRRAQARKVRLLPVSKRPNHQHRLLTPREQGALRPRKSVNTRRRESANATSCSAGRPRSPLSPPLAPRSVIASPLERIRAT